MSLVLPFFAQGDAAAGVGVSRAHTEQPNLAWTPGLVSSAAGTIMAQGPKLCWPRGSSVPESLSWVISLSQITVPF